MADRRPQQTGHCAWCHQILPAESHFNRRYCSDAHERAARGHMNAHGVSNCSGLKWDRCADCDAWLRTGGSGRRPSRCAPCQSARSRRQSRHRYLTNGPRPTVRNTPIRRSCRWCLQPFTGRPNARWCSTRCKKAAENHRNHNSTQHASDLTWSECQWCGSNFIVKPHNSYAMYCSRQCVGAHRTNRDLVGETSWVCSWCHRPFVGSWKGRRNARHVTCSPQCSSGLSGHLHAGDVHRNANSSPIDWRRCGCGEEFIARPKARNRVLCPKCKTHYRTKRGNSPVSRRTSRRRVWLRDNKTCHICGMQIRTLDDMHVDHLIPVAAGGTDNAENLAAAHAFCNLSRGTTGPAQLRLID